MPKDSFMALPSHLYVRGLIDGRHSDITVHCFGASYALHKLLLDRAPFFCSALSEPWFESTAKEITLHPEEMDSNITQASFELALKRIYGCTDREEEEKHPTSLFATGCWLEMSDLIESSITSMLNQMAPSNLADCITLVTSNYYGKYGTQILTAAKAMLYREGYEMLLKNFNGLSGELIKEILSSDAFYVPGEWDRWILARKVFNRRVRAKGISLGLIDNMCHLKIARPRMTPIAFREQLRYECDNDTTSDSSLWIQLYTDPDIVSLFELLENGIHYTHMNFEQLQQVKIELDVLKIVPVVPQAVISNALWQSMLLRQRITNAEENEVDLGFAEFIPEENSPFIEKSSDQEPSNQDKEGDENDVNLHQPTSPRPQRYRIPSIDSMYELGTTDGSRGVTMPDEKTTRIQPSDLAEFVRATLSENDTTELASLKIINCPGPNSMYSEFPPFRFSVEFPPMKSLKDRERVNSNTVWYAGSIWYVYIQKQETSKGVQLGIYLHREKCPDTLDDTVRGMTHNANVDQRINSIERELYIRQRGRRRLDNALRRPSGDLSDFYPDSLRARITPDLDTISGLMRPRSSAFKSSEGSPAQDRSLNTAGAFAEGGEEPVSQNAVLKKPTLPPYIDSRATIKTYFKIYVPSRGGRVMSIYESAPDQFDFQQSWGWKSANLIMDDNLEGKAAASALEESRLRFMVVIGQWLDLSVCAYLMNYRHSLAIKKYLDSNVFECSGRTSPWTLLTQEILFPQIFVSYC